MRNSRLFRQLAWRGLRANRELFVPYLLATALIVCLFNLMASLANNEFVQTRSSALTILIQFGTGVIGLFAAVFVLYARSFVDRRRVRELALYSVLGLQRRHVAQVLFWETLWVGVCALLGGLLSAALLGHLAFMLLNALMGLPARMGYTLSWSVTLLTLKLFGVLFLITWAWQVTRLSLSTPMAQLAAQNAGEREPRAKWLVFLLGLLALGGGYALSLTTKQPLAALQMLFIAIVLVIFGTYGLFSAGSIFILKRLRSNRRFYYRPQAFIAVSGMLYRMGQNATGLANIAVLLTMIVVALATTVTMYIGAEDTLRNWVSLQNRLVLTSTLEAPAKAPSLIQRQTVMQQAQQRVHTLTMATGRQLTQQISSRTVSAMGHLSTDNSFQPLQQGEPLWTAAHLPDVLTIMTATTFNAYSGATLQLSAGQLRVAGSPRPFISTTLSIGTSKLAVQPLKPSELGPQRLRGLMDKPAFKNVLMIVPDEQTLEQLKAALIRAGASGEALTDTLTYAWETDAPNKASLLSYAQTVQNAKLTSLLPSKSPGTDFKYDSRALLSLEFYSINGGFLFLGVFLGLVFAVGAVLITYFKQVSEGHDDRKRFKTMTQIGLDAATIRRTTDLQLLWMFFLPLGVATIHTLFAFPILSQLLMLFGIADAHPFLLSILGVVLLVTALYYLVYRLTSRVYLRIVQGWDAAAVGFRIGA